MNRFVAFTVGVFLLVSTFGLGVFINSTKSGTSERARSPSEVSKKGTREIREQIQSAQTVFSDHSLYTSGQCVGKLDAIYDQMNNLKLEDFLISDLYSAAPALLQELFNLRVMIRSNLQTEFFGARKDSNAVGCITAHRRLFRAMRVFEDYLGMIRENRLLAPGLSVATDEKEYKVFKGNDINILWNPVYKPQNPLVYVPQSGDVLLSRGSASVSAAIARITDEDSNFSHAGIIYIDKETGKTETIEAHIEFGTLVADIANYSDTKARALVFRFHDPKILDDETGTAKEKNAAIAHEAAKAIRQKVLDYKKKYGNSRMPNPCYDFSMNIDNPTVITPTNGKCLFCSEVVSLAFSLVGDGKYNIPTFKSSINPKNRKFLEDIGVTVKETFAPADLEVEPYFDLVLEWRDYNRIHKTHVMDAILTAMYSWMDDYGYQFFVPPGANVKTNLAFSIRRIPILDHMTGIKDKFPLNMRKEAINTMVMLDEVSNQLKDVIYDEEIKRSASLTPREMIGLLNQWRIKDAADYKSASGYNTDKDPLKAHRVHHLLRAK